MRIHCLQAPLAITMWDFSWLERRWPGAGYEDIDLALDELVQRGYNAVRIDAYPHLIAEDANREWTILPKWNQQVWGSPAKNKVVVQPNLNEFLRRCADRGILVGLSSWFQKAEETDLRYICSPERHAEIWRRTLDLIADANLLDTILFVDLCNEWPFFNWAPFYKPRESTGRKWHDPDSLTWMERSVTRLRESYPDIDYTYSYVGTIGYDQGQGPQISRINDFLEPHIWMVHARQDAFYSRFDYRYNAFDSKGFENVVEHAQKLYEVDPDYWKKLLEEHIDNVVAESVELDRSLITTECWGIVDYKDWPLLDWEWVKDICAHGVRYASSKGRWFANATSNFCGPQFVGMWRDVDWHQEMTKVIKSADLPPRSNAALHRMGANEHEISRK